MADSAALRNRRKRLHAQGNHALCRRCPAVAGTAVAGDLARPGVPGMVEDAVRKFLALRPFNEGDPRGISSVIAVRLAQAVDAEASPMAVRELTVVVKYLASWSDLPGDGDFIDELNLAGHARGLERVMASLQQHMGTPE